MLNNVIAPLQLTLRIWQAVNHNPGQGFQGSIHPWRMKILDEWQPMQDEFPRSKLKNIYRTHKNITFPILIIKIGRTISCLCNHYRCKQFLMNFSTTYVITILNIEYDIFSVSLPLIKPCVEYWLFTRENFDKKIEMSKYLNLMNGWRNEGGNLKNMVDVYRLHGHLWLNRSKRTIKEFGIPRKFIRVHYRRNFMQSQEHL